MYFYRSSTESHFRNMRGVAGINTSISWPQSASVVVSEPHCTADVCSVNCLALMAGKAPYTREWPRMKCYSTLKNDYITFYIRHVTCKRENKTFPL